MAGTIVPFETRVDRETRERRERLAREGQELAERLNAHFSEDFGVALFAFDTKDGSCVFLSNVPRPDVLKAVRSWVARQEARQEGR